MTLHERFEQFEDEMCEFKRVTVTQTKRPDLCAFLILDSILPGKRDMVCSAAHDQIWLDVDCDELEKVITDDQIKDLVRCGVWHDDDIESLSMFV